MTLSDVLKLAGLARAIPGLADVLTAVPRPVLRATLPALGALARGDLAAARRLFEDAVQTVAISEALEARYPAKGPRP